MDIRSHAVSVGWGAFGEGSLIFVAQDYFQYRRILSGCGDIIYSIQIYTYAYVHVDYYTYRVSKQFLCTCAKMVRHCAGSGEVSNAKHCKRHKWFLSRVHWGPSQRALWNQVLYIHCDFHSKLHHTCYRCTGTFRNSSLSALKHKLTPLISGLM